MTKFRPPGSAAHRNFLALNSDGRTGHVSSVNLIDLAAGVGACLAPAGAVANGT